MLQHPWLRRRQSEATTKRSVARGIGSIGTSRAHVSGSLKRGPPTTHLVPTDGGREESERLCELRVEDELGSEHGGHDGRSSGGKDDLTITSSLLIGNPSSGNAPTRQADRGCN